MGRNATARALARPAHRTRDGTGPRGRDSMERPRAPLRSPVTASMTARPILALSLVTLLGAVAALAAAPPQELPQPRLEDFIAEPGSTQHFQPFMLHADLWLGIDQRSKLDTIVFVLENGARCAQVLNRDSTWA